jgi:hypothetical protein
MTDIPTSNGDADAEDLARADAAVTYARIRVDTVRRDLQIAQAGLERAERIRQALLDHYHTVRTPTRQHSAISKGDESS